MYTRQTPAEIDWMIYCFARDDMRMCDASLCQLASKMKHLPKTKKHSTLITLALPNSSDPSEIVAKLRGLDYKYLTSYVFSLEYFSKNGENLHAHMFLPYSVPKAKIIRDFSRKFKVKENFIDVRKRDTADGATRAEAYVKGLKKDFEKAEFVKQDEEWRIQNKIENFYEIKI